jgi:hypothetical protein
MNPQGKGSVEDSDKGIIIFHCGGDAEAASMCMMAAVISVPVAEKIQWSYHQKCQKGQWQQRAARKIRGASIHQRLRISEI